MQKGVYAEANTTCYTYLDTYGEVEIQINRIMQKATQKGPLRQSLSGYPLKWEVTFVGYYRDSIY